MQDTEKKPSAASLFATQTGDNGRPVVYVPIEQPNGETFTAEFELHDQKTRNRHDQLYTGGIHKKKGDPEAAIAFVFDKKFIKTNIEWGDMLTAGGYKDEKDFFKRNQMGQLAMQAMVNAYLRKTSTEAQDLNE